MSGEKKEKMREEEEIVLEKQIKEFGQELLEEPLPLSIHDQLILIHRLESFLLQIGQCVSLSMKKALFPSMTALIAPKFFNHTDRDVRASVTSCLIELMRITAPQEPYNDHIVKQIFHLAVESFEWLSHMSTHGYTKAISILDTFARVRSVLVMLDLHCGDLIVRMFRLFLSAARYKHADIIVSSMEKVMTSVLEESDHITWDLLSPLLASVKKKDRGKSTSWKLGEKVLTLSASKLKPYLLEAVRDRKIVLDDYAPTVTAICRDEIDLPNLNNIDSSELNLVSKHDDDNSKEMEQFTHPKNSKATNVRVNAEPNSLDSMKDDRSNIHAETGLRKRGRKPNPLINSEEGYDPWIDTKKPKISHLKKTVNQRTNGLVIGCPVSGKSAANSQNGKSIKCKPFSPKSDLPKKKGKMLKQDISHEEKGPQSDNGLEIEQKSSKTLEIKKRKRSIRAEIPGDCLENTTLHSANEEMEKNGEEMEKNGTGSSSAQIGSEQKSWVHDKPAKKKIKAGNEAPKTKPKRKQSAEKGKVSGTLGLGAELIGKRIKVWWPMDKIYYEGVVNSYDDTEKRHTVLYTDDAEEVLNLKTERWKLIDDDVSPSILKENISGKRSEKTPQGKADSNWKDMSSSTPETAGIKVGNHVITDGPIENPSIMDCLKLDSERSAEKLKIESSNTDTDSENTLSAETSFKFQRIRSADDYDEVCKPDGEPSEKSNCGFEVQDCDSSKMDDHRIQNDKGSLFEADQYRLR